MYNFMDMADDAYESCRRDAELDRHRNYPVMSLATLGKFANAVSQLPDDFETLIGRRS